MVINFGGQMSLEDILEKNLIQISITKAKTHEVVQTKLREQIMENLQGKPMFSTKPSFENDLAVNNCNTTIEQRQLNKTGTKTPGVSCDDRVDFQTNQFKDTFEHFSTTNATSDGIEAFDGNDFSYL